MGLLIFRRDRREKIVIIVRRVVNNGFHMVVVAVVSGSIGKWQSGKRTQVLELFWYYFALVTMNGDEFTVIQRF